MEEDVEWHSTLHDFNLEAFLTCETSVPVISGPFCALDTLFLMLPFAL